MDERPGQSPGLSSLEQVNALEACQTRNRPFLRGVNMENRKVLFFRPRCKMWSCPVCSEINKSLWAVKAYHAAEQLTGNQTHIDFLTLTSHEKLTAEASLKVWPKAWSRLGQRARRKSKYFQYLMIPEQHKDGRLHIHAIETAGLGSRWWKDNARECGLGYIAEEKPVRTPQGAALYVVKYLTKSLMADVWPDNYRRVRTSQKWPKLPQGELPEGWTFEPLSKDEDLAVSVAAFEGNGFDVLVIDHREAWAIIGEYDEEQY